jgi:hypothetical protein
VNKSIEWIVVKNRSPSPVTPHYVLPLSHGETKLHYLRFAACSS